jgi:uncharacterized membrane protein
MIDQIFYAWILIFLIFLIVNIIARSTTFGMIGGFWLMILGLAILITGFQMQTGVTQSAGTVTNVYSDAVLPFSTYAYVWGLFMIGCSMYMVLANARARTT